MTENLQSQSNPLPLNTAVTTQSVSLTLYDEDDGDGSIFITGTTVGIASGAEVSILITDQYGNSTTVLAVVSANQFVVFGIDTSTLSPGPLGVIASVNDLIHISKQPFVLVGVQASDPITIEASSFDANNKISVQGTAKAFKDDEITLVIRDTNGSSVTATALVDADGEFSVSGISTQGLMDGVLVIDVLAQTSNGSVSIENANTLILANQVPAGTDKTLAVNEDTARVLTVADFGYVQGNTTFAMTGIKIAGLTSMGTLKLNGNPLLVDDFVNVAQINAGQLVFQGAQDGNGTAYDSFKFKVLDNRPTYNEDPTAKTITFNVTPVNDAPVNTVPGTQTVAEDTSLAISGLSVNDVDGNLATTRLTVSDGTLNVNLAGGATISAGGNNTGTLTLSGTQSQINAALATVSYKGRSDYTGSDTLFMLSTDSAGTPLTDSDTVTINITPIDDAPVLITPGVTVNPNEDSASTTAVALWSTAPTYGRGGGSDEVNQTLSFKINTIPLFITLFKADGITDVTAGTTLTAIEFAALRYKTVEDKNGTGSVTFEVIDSGSGSAPNVNTLSGQSVIMTVNPVNDAPVLANTSTLAYTENDAAKAINTTITVLDVDNTTLASATVAITAGFNSTQDVLSLTINPATMGNITGVYTSTTGLMNLTSVGNSATLAQWQAALRAVSYSNTSENPSTAARTVSYTVNDGSTNGNTVTSTINLTAVNDAPVLATGSTLDYTENAAATAINTAIAVADADSITLASATVAITAGFNSTQDVLSLTPNAATMGNITGVYTSTTGVMTLTSVGNSATLAQWQAALRAVSYSNTSENPSTAARTVSYSVNDGSLNGNTVTSTINVTAVNDAATFSGDISKSITETNAAQTVTGTLTVSDVDSLITVTPRSNVAGSAGYGKFSITSDGAWTYVMNNAQNQFEQGETYIDTFTVATADGTEQVISVVINGTNDAPTMFSSVTSFSGATFAEDGGPVLARGGDITLADVDSDKLMGATVRVVNPFSGSFVTGDLLTYNIPDGSEIEGEYDEATGVLTFEGVASKADYQSLLNSVKFNNLRDDLAGGARNVFWSVKDTSGAESIEVKSGLSVTRFNDAPVLVDSNLNLVTIQPTTAETQPSGQVGVLVSSLLGGVTDGDGAAVAKGIAIIAANDALGKVFFSVNNGGSWFSPAGTISSNAALLLKADTATRVYFRPNAGVEGNIPDALTIRAWDTTDNKTSLVSNNVSLHDITATGDKTAYSANTDTVALSVLTTASAGLTGTSDAETLEGTAGNDVIVGNGGVDLIDAKEGNDKVVLNNSNVAALSASSAPNIDAGTDVNTLKLTGTEVLLDLTNATVQSNVDNFSVVDITSNVNNLLKLNLQNVQTLSAATNVGTTPVDESKMLVVHADTGDAVVLQDAASWSVVNSLSGSSLTTIYGANYGFSSTRRYSQYSKDGASLFVDELAPVADIVGTSGNSTLTGTANAEVIYGNGGVDTINAGAGNDTVILTASSISALNAGTNTAAINGEAGVNTLKISGINQTLDLTNLTVNKLDNFNVIDLKQGSGNKFKLHLDQVLSLAGGTDNLNTAAVNESKMLVLQGNGGQQVNRLQLVDAIDWTSVTNLGGTSLQSTFGAAYGFEAGRSYTQYTNGTATLFVDQTLFVESL